MFAVVGPFFLLFSCCLYILTWYNYLKWRFLNNLHSLSQIIQHCNTEWKYNLNIRFLDSAIYCFIIKDSKNILYFFPSPTASTTCAQHSEPSSRVSTASSWESFTVLLHKILIGQPNPAYAEKRHWHIFLISFCNLSLGNCFLVLNFHLGRPLS